MPCPTSLLVEWCRLPSHGHPARTPSFRWSGALADAIPFHGAPPLLDLSPAPSAVRDVLPPCRSSVSYRPPFPVTTSHLFHSIRRSREEA
uniref:Uncharacterized protein n=1 Tax=Arundo donax TaxID=35708 RepID=A0A0A8Y6P6_ARUDO